MMIRIVFTFLISTFIVFTTQDEKYGKFEFSVAGFWNCKGPKLTDCTAIESALVNRSTVLFNVTVLKPLVLKKGKIITKINGKNLIRFQMSNPCTHIFFKQLFMASYKMTKNCLINKGNYPLYFDITRLATDYYGGAFIYGNVTFSTVLLGEECNFACTNLDAIISPKHK